MLGVAAHRRILSLLTPFLHPATTPASYLPLARGTEVPDTAKQKLGESVVEYRNILRKSKTPRDDV